MKEGCPKKVVSFTPLFFGIGWPGALNRHHSLAKQKTPPSQWFFFVYHISVSLDTQSRTVLRFTIHEVKYIKIVPAQIWVSQHNNQPKKAKRYRKKNETESEQKKTASTKNRHPPPAALLAEQNPEAPLCTAWPCPSRFACSRSPKDAKLSTGWFGCGNSVGNCC